MGWYDFAPYESVAAKRAKAEKLAARLVKQGRKLRPVRIQGKAIASTFWGKAWCDNVERYSDYGNRLPRGRSCVRHGAVIHLEVEHGQIVALVSGSSLYEVRIGLEAVKPAAWRMIRSRCSGQIGSMIELLQGKLSQAVMKIVTDPDAGLFPKRKEIDIRCSCPDYAGMCKHIAAVLYAIGSRLDEQPELLFALRGIDHHELIAEALPGPGDFSNVATSGTIAADDLGAIFGIDIEIGTPAAAPAEKTTKQAPRAKASTKARAAKSQTLAQRRSNSRESKSTRKPSPARPVSAAANSKVPRGETTVPASLSPATKKRSTKTRSAPKSTARTSAKIERTTSNRTSPKSSAASRATKSMNEISRKTKPAQKSTADTTAKKLSTSNGNGIPAQPVKSKLQAPVKTESAPVERKSSISGRSVSTGKSRAKSPAAQTSPRSSTRSGTGNANGRETYATRKSTSRAKVPSAAKGRKSR